MRPGETYAAGPGCRADRMFVKRREYRISNKEPTKSEGCCLPTDVPHRSFIRSTFLVRYSIFPSPPTCKEDTRFKPDRAFGLKLCQLNLRGYTSAPLTPAPQTAVSFPPTRSSALPELPYRARFPHRKPTSFVQPV